MGEVDPNARLPRLRNRVEGIKARSAILKALGSGPLPAREIKSATGLSYGRLQYHLKLLEKHRLVKRGGGKRPLLWVKTGLGQQVIG